MCLPKLRQLFKMFFFIFLELKLINYRKSINQNSKCNIYSGFSAKFYSRKSFPKVPPGYCNYKNILYVIKSERIYFIEQVWHISSRNKYERNLRETDLYMSLKLFNYKPPKTIILIKETISFGYHRPFDWNLCQLYVTKTAFLGDIECIFFQIRGRVFRQFTQLSKNIIFLKELGDTNHELLKMYQIIFYNLRLEDVTRQKRDKNHLFW